MLKLLRFLCPLLCLVSVTASAQLRISEFMASNSDTLADEDGSFEDWIEIQNASAGTVDLLDWSLTDSAGNLTKWRFPSTNLPPGGFLVVFASNKDRRTAGAPLHTSFKLDAGGEYLALVDPTGTNIVTQFAPTYPPQVPDVSFGFALTASNVTLVATNAAAKVLVPSVANGGSSLNYAWTGSPLNEPFNTGSWTGGLLGVGFGSGNVGLDVEPAMLNSNASAFVRVEFVADAPTNFSMLTLRLRYDDGFVAWLNGTLLAQANAPVAELAWNSSATSSHSAAAFEEMAFGGATNLLRAGTNVLAIQGLNVAAGDTTFLVLPELIGTTLAGETSSGLYFATSTPGAENLGGTVKPGPGIANVSHTPAIPLDHDNLVVTARVFPTAQPISSVVLRYRVMFGAEVALTMFDDGAHGDGAGGDGVFGATIPAAASTNSQMVRYFITATDTSNTVSRLPVFSDPASTAQYFGTVINPGYVTSSLPIIHLFAPAGVLQQSMGPTNAGSFNWPGADSQTGGRVSLYYDGEFYDNIYMELRGNSTAGYYKKSHRLEFNREHKFRHAGSSTRIRKTSFTADYPDPTYMRQGLAFWLSAESGAPGPFYDPYRLQLNGAFYQLANHNDVHGEELLERLGYDPNGALYNAAGTIQPSQFSYGGFDKKTRTWETNADYTALANAISESLPLGQRMTNLFDRLDLPQVISYMVAARFVHENDDVWANMSLYHDNDGDDLWRIIPFDMNLSWGAAFVNSASLVGIQATNDALKSHPLYGSSPTSLGDWNRMYDVIFQVPQTREMFLRRMRTFLDTWVKPPGTPTNQLPIEAKVLAWRDLIRDEANRDRNWWGWAPDGGQNNLYPDLYITNGVDELLTNFLALRRQHFYGKHSWTNTALPIGISSTQNAGIPPAQPANASVSIVGWDYSPASGNQAEEYVQLTNTNGFAADISGWELDGGIQFKFQGGTVIPAGGSLYVSPDVRSFRNRTISPRGGQGLFVVGPYSGRLNAWGESLTLRTPSGFLASSNGFAGNPSAVQRSLRVTEIMYNPSSHPAVTNDAQLFEYIELKNISTNLTLDLAGVRFTNGIHFNFTGSAVTSLAPQQSVLLVRNAACFTARFGAGPAIAGQFTGALDNGGESLRLEDANGEKVLEFDYDDDWYPITDGLGFSLVIVNEHAPWNTWDRKASWRASGIVNGSPGAMDPAPQTAPPILINEVLAHTDLPDRDSIELFNPAATSVDIGGWFLSDDFFLPRKYRIPNGTTIAAGGYLVFNDTQFNAGPNAFLLSEYGESAWLFSGDANTNLTGYYHGWDFKASPNGISFGRHVDSQTNTHFVLQSVNTLNATNALPRVGPVVISEILFHPPDLTNGADNDLDEFVELQNITAASVPLYCTFTNEPGYGPAALTNTWRLRNAVDFDFPTNVILPAGARLLVVGFNPTNTAQLAAFRARCNVSNTVPVFGPWSGKLDNSGEQIELKYPDRPDTSGALVVPYVMVEEVNYSDAAPWPGFADGLGNSLQRVDSASFGNDPANWFAAASTGGAPNVPNLLPSVFLVAPTNGAVFGRLPGFTLSATSVDPDGAITELQFLDGATILATLTSPPWEYHWTNPPPGMRSVRVRSRDNLDGIAQSAVVSVTITSLPPVIVLTSPATETNLVAGTPVVLSASATDPDGSVTRVDFLENGSLLGSATAPPFSLAWLPAPGGTHVISAIAHDDDGESSEPDAVTVHVQAVLSNPMLIPSGATWRYLDNGVDMGTNWLVPGFDDSAWSSGVGRFGFNNNNNSGISTVVSYGSDASNKHRTTYFRRQFVVGSLTGMTNLLLEYQRDDGVAFHLNSVEILRNNLTNGVPIRYSDFATNASDNGATLFSVKLPLGSLVIGTNTLAAEVHQSSAGSSDLVFDARLGLLGALIAPGITAQPQDQTVTNGQPAVFGVVATGTGPFTYQWSHGATNIPGMNTASISLASVTTNDAGGYSVTIANPAGSVTSRVAWLTVWIDNPDSDGDGIPDWWEQLYFGGLAGPGTNDVDGDGFSALQEYLAGTDPTNSASALKFDSTALAGEKLILQFAAISNRAYTIQQSPLTNGSGWLPWLDVPETPSNRMVTLTNNSPESQMFYRLVTPPVP